MLSSGRERFAPPIGPRASHHMFSSNRVRERPRSRPLGYPQVVVAI